MQPQVVIPQRTSTSMSYPHMSSPQASSPNVRQVQAPVQRTSIVGISQLDGTQDVYRRQSAHQVPTPPTSKPIQRTASRNESVQQSHQMPLTTPNRVQAHQQPHLQPQPQQQQQQQRQRAPQDHDQAKLEQQQQQQQRQRQNQWQQQQQQQQQQQRMSIDNMVQVKVAQQQPRPTPQAQATPQRVKSQSSHQPKVVQAISHVQITPPRASSQSLQQPKPPQAAPQIQITPQRTPSQSFQQPTPIQKTPQPQTPSQVPPSQQSSSQPRSHPKVVIPRPPSHQLTSPTKTAPAQLSQKALPADLSVMLLSAADEYIAAARSLGSSVARQRKSNEVQQYHKLMSTAMGCMDAVLRKYNMQPRDEAKLRLRYASLLIEETENTTEIEEILSKGVSLCARCRLQDLRYSMLHLQARYQFKTNHRAAFKALDKNISEAETFQQIAWVYAFRFLKVSLLLQSPDRMETIPALQQLHAISTYATKRGDTTVGFACNALEAMVHLRSSAQDRMTEAQRAIAQARSLQLTMSAKQQGTFGTFFDVVDLACGIHQNVPDSAKSTALVQATADENDDGLGTGDGIFTVILDRTSGGTLTSDTGGIFRKTAEGRDELMFTWLPREDIKALCFHLCALDQNVHEKSQTLAQEARSRCRDLMRSQSPYGLPISTSCSQLQWRKILYWHATFTHGLIGAHREDQATANEALGALTRRVAAPPYANYHTYTATLSYLEAIIDQNNGRFDAALATYSSSTFTVPDKNHAPTLRNELGILAAMNRLLIARDPSYPDHENIEALLTQIAAACEEHPRQYIRMAYSLLNALCAPGQTELRHKTLMNGTTQKSHDLFKRTHNRDFVVMSLCYFTARFFIEPVTAKSISAANAVRQHAKASNKPVWIAVACGLLIRVFEHANNLAEKQRYEEVYEKTRLNLPAPLRGDDVDAEGEDDDGDVNMMG